MNILRLLNFSVRAADVHRQLFFPHGPVVGHTVPLPQGIADAFAPQFAAEFAVLMDQFIFFAHGEDDLLLTQVMQPPMVMFAADVLNGVVLVDDLFVMAVREPPDVAQAAQRNDTIDTVRVPKA